MKKVRQSLSNPTEMLRFVEALKQQWMDTFDAIPDPVMMVDKDYVVQRANQAMASLADRPVKQLIGKKCYSLFAGRRTPCTGCKLQQEASGEKTLPYELENSSRNKFFEVVAKRVANSNQVMHVYRDRTEAKHMESQLQQNEKLASIGLLAGGFAHEINNPIGGILVFAQMLLRELPKDSPHLQDVVEIEGAAKRCKAIVESLLDFARQRGPAPGPAKLEATSVHDSIRVALRFAQLGHNRGNRCHVNLKLEAAPDGVLAEKNKLIQVFLNLFTNALQAMPKQGTLSIETYLKKDSTISVIVKDTGVGIKKENLKKVFDPFFTTKQPGSGTGLGLSIVHGIMADFGGSINVASTPGRGTTFTLSFKASPALGTEPVKSSLPKKAV